MRIAIDAAGGDEGLNVTVPAALQASTMGVEIVLVGDRNEILNRIGGASHGVDIVDAPEVITGDAQPVKAVRRKQNSSLVVGINLLAAGSVDCFVSAGNTGALMAAGILLLKTIEGVERAALGTMLPTVDGRGTFCLDIGANADPKPEHLLAHALMGDAFMRLSRDIERPRIALLNVGTEPRKGSEVYRRAHALLASSDLNFIGNIEGRDLMAGAADVIVCDGFVGNVLLKFAEGMAGTLFGLLKREVYERGWRTKLGAAMVKPAIAGVRRALDYRAYGGAPLLGLAGLVIKCHGSSNVEAMVNGIALGKKLVEQGLIDDLRSAMVASMRGDRFDEQQ